MTTGERSLATAQTPPETRNKPEGALILPLGIDLWGRRQTYGLWHFQRLRNQHLVAGGRRPLNHKRVYWIMWQNNLLQTRLTNSQPCEAHTGKVSTLQWNQHWGPWRAWDCLRQEREGRVIFAWRLGEAVVAFSATTCGYRVNRA